jgi:non-specific serine/threonine protein kinase
MGDVYRAKDLKLGRDIAIKVLRPELASHPERLRRFEQEARAASALDHPNIVTIHDISESDGIHYIVMQFVEGQTLRELLSEGPLPTEKFLRLATQIAEGLAKAHTAGIIHRDLKPENLMVTADGYVKILDFGLVKLLVSAAPIETETPTLNKEGTLAGTVMGTASYMSPEQALGKALDARTDVFSLGSVLYEMATGKRAFEGNTLAGLFNEILNKAPTPPSRLNPDLPVKLTQIIEKSLEKDPANRYPSAAEAHMELARVKPDTEPSQEMECSIVVLPFEDISPDRDNEYFSDGLTEEVIADLSQVPELCVISRSSAMTLKGTKKTAKEISKELDVQYVLEGSVRKAGNNLRITAQLIDAVKDVHLWARKYSGALDDVFDIQETVSRSIVDSLKLELRPETDRRIARRPIDNVHAYECYLRSRQEMWRFTEEGLKSALQLLQKGLDITGDNALLYASMGTAYWQYINIGIEPAEFDHYIQKTETYADKALELDPNSAHGYFLRGLIFNKRGNMQEAVRHLKRALSIEPDNADALYWLALFLSFCGKTSEARPLAKRFLEVDPLTPFSFIAGWLDYVDGDLEAVLEPSRRMVQMYPKDVGTRWVRAVALAGNERLDELSSIVDSMEADAPHAVMTRSAMFLKHALLGEKATALQAVSQKLTATAERDEFLPLLMAESYALIERKDEALEWLEHAVSRGFINYPFLSKYDPLLGNIRSEGRFKRLMERVKDEWERFEV